MRFRDGTLLQKAIFWLLMLIFAIGLGIAIADKSGRIGTPDVGFMLDDGSYVAPTRNDASDAGLRGGGRAVSVNGIPVPRDVDGVEQLADIRMGLGETNRLVLQHHRGDERVLDIPVREWRWQDVLFAEGAIDVIALAFFAVGLTVFLLRPWQFDTWALLVLSSSSAAILLTFLVPEYAFAVLYPYQALVYPLLNASVFHLALAFPVIHPLLRKRCWFLRFVYGFAALKAAFGISVWYLGSPEGIRLSGSLGLWLLAIGIVLSLSRSIHLAFFSPDSLVRQRARIHLGGMLFGLTPVVALEIARDAFHIVTFDSRFAYWALVVFLIALARITVRQELMNARIAVRRAVIYTVAVGILTTIAIALSAERSYAVAVLLFPLLYFWPRFDARLNARLYPQRTRYPEVVRAIGDDLAGASHRETVFELLARAGGRLCDAKSGVAFLLPSGSDAGDVAATSATAPSADVLANDALVRLMAAMRKEISRDQIAALPQYRNVQSECQASFDRLDADLLLPLLRDHQVVGGLAVGARRTGDPYESPEIDALAAVMQQAAQAIGRVEATERLRAREREFADLARFFPPQIIDQVMERGGAAELRSQRRLVTVLFADLRGFTAFSDRAEPEEVMATLAQFHEAMGRRIAENAGTVERFAGDGVMVFFNDPVEQPDHAERAVHTALAARSDVRRLKEEWERKGFGIDVGMGIHTGYATCGFIGFEGRRDYGVIGNVTNLAARLSDAAKADEILVTARVCGELRNGFRAEPIGELNLKGFQQPQMAYRLLDGGADATRQPRISSNTPST
jgi:class 3 adenylate cyclase